MITVNNRVACTPFETTDTTVEVKGGLAIIKQKTELTKLQVVFPTWDKYVVGNTVYVKGECCKHAFAKEVYEVDGVKFVLVPYEMIVGWDTPATK